MGRIATDPSDKRLRYAKSIGCTSVDGTKWVRFRDRYLDAGLAECAAPQQTRLVA